MNEVFQLPAAIDAERMVLGAMILNEGGLRPEVEADEFYLPSHRLIFLRMCEIDGLIDLVTLREHLLRHGELETIGGEAYLSHLTDGTPKLQNVDEYVKLIKEKSALRKVVVIAQRTMVQALDPDSGTAEEVSANAHRDLLGLIGTGKGGLRAASEIIRTQFRSIDRIDEAWQAKKGTPTGFRRYDEMTGGVHPSEMVIVAARPSIGKTSFALNVGINVGRTTQGTIAIFSLEMSKEAVVLRMLCSEARVDSHRLETGFATQADRRALADAAVAIAGLQLYIDDQIDIRPETMLARAKALKARAGSLALVVVDYIQLVSVGSRGRQESRYQEISYVSRFMKQMAKELACPVLALSQLNRAPEERTGPPRLSDLRESGQLEQDADTVCFLWREPTTGGKEHPSRRAGAQAEPAELDIVKLIVEKQRNGPTGDMKLRFRRQFTRFEDYEVSGGVA